MAHGPVVPQNFSSKTNSYENDFSGLFDALHQRFLVKYCIYIVNFSLALQWDSR